LVPNSAVVPALFLGAGPRTVVVPALFLRAGPRTVVVPALFLRAGPRTVVVPALFKEEQHGALHTVFGLRAATPRGVTMTGG
jgi:hypothetical protein